MLNGRTVESGYRPTTKAHDGDRSKDGFEPPAPSSARLVRRGPRHVHSPARRSAAAGRHMPACFTPSATAGRRPEPAHAALKPGALVREGDHAETRTARPPNRPSAAAPSPCLREIHGRLLFGRRLHAYMPKLCSRKQPPYLTIQYAGSTRCDPFGRDALSLAAAPFHLHRFFNSLDRWRRSLAAPATSSTTAL